MKNVRGMINKQVQVKSYLGTEYMSYAPSRKKNRKVGELEQANRERFRESTVYAKEAVKIAELKALYATLRIKKNHTAYITAIIDATYPPKITSLITQGYLGKAGSVILVQVTDKIKVKRVQVSVYDPAMQVIEQGEAIDNGDGFNWMYTANRSVDSINGFTVEAKAYDIAGNETVKTLMVT